MKQIYTTPQRNLPVYSRRILVCAVLLLLNSSALARECKSCQEHRNGGSITYGNVYAPGGVYQSGGTYYPGGVYQFGGTYYPGGVYPSYGYNPYNRQYRAYRSHVKKCGAGSISGDRNLSGNGCETRYHGPASKTQYHPQSNKQIRQLKPHRLGIPSGR